MIRIKNAVPLALIFSAACHHGGAPGAAPTPKLPAGVTAQMISQGDSAVHAPTAFCQRCHGAGLTGGTSAPSLVAGAWLQSAGTFPEIASIVINGVPKDKIKDPAHNFQMNPRGGPMNLSDGQARLIAAYVWSISRAKTKPAG
jgi:mono/diheme cytochrome c family protein